MTAGADDDALFLRHIGQQHIKVLHVLLAAGFGQIGGEQLLGRFQVLAGHVAALRHAEADVAAHEHLEILQEDFLRGLAVQLLAGLEHLGGKGVDLDARDFGEAVGGGDIDGSAGGAAEDQRIREDGRQQQTGDLRPYLDAVLIVHLGDDGGGAAYRLVAEIDRAAGLEAADAVVVDDLQDLSLVEALHGLGGLVVVHQDDAALAQGDDVAAADHAAVLAVLVEDGEVAVAHLGHHAGDVGHRGHEGEFHDVVAGHIVGDGGALAHELAGGVGVAGGGHDGNAGLLGDALDGAAHLGAVADDEEGCFLLDGAQLALIAVGQDDDVALFDVVFQHLRGSSADFDMAGGADGVLVADDHGAAEGLEDIFIGGAAGGKHTGVEHVHVGRGDVLHGDDAFQLVVGARDGQGVDLLVAHDLPCLAQTGGAGDAGHLAVVHITDLRVDVGTHPGRRDAEPLEHEFRLLVHPSGPAGLADEGACLIFQLCVRNGRADRVGVRIAMSDDHDFMSCLWHRFLPPYGSWVVLLIMIPERRFVRVPARRRKGKPSGSFHCNTRWNEGKVAQRSRSLKILRDSCIHLLAFWGKTLYHRDKSVYFKKAPSGAARRSE